MLFAALVLATSLSSETQQRIDTIAQNALRAYHVQAMSIAIVDHGSIVFASGYGGANEHTRFQVGSVTKELVAADALAEFAQRKISVRTPFRKFFGDGPSANVTIQELLSQRSGLQDYNDLGTVLHFPGKILEGTITPEELGRHVLRQRPAFAPGSHFTYANSNYLVLGLLLEQLRDEPAGRILARDVFEPFGMRDSALSTAGICSEGACGFTKTPLGVLSVAPWNTNLTFTAGGMTSSAFDLAKLDVALMTNSRFERWRTLITQSYGDTDYTWGAHLYHELGHTVVWQDGTVLGFKAMNSLILDERSAVVVLMNADYAHAPIVAMQIESAMFGLPGGDGERVDLNLPQYTYPIALMTGLIPIGAMLALHRKSALIASGSLLTYAAGTFAWQLALPPCVALLLFLAISTRRRGPQRG